MKTEEQESVYDELSFIFKDTPAYLINWLRDNKKEVEQYLKEVEGLIKDVHIFMDELCKDKKNDKESGEGNHLVVEERLKP
jgi:hypothetical protein